MKTDKELAIDAADEIFEASDFEPVKNKVFTKDEFRRLTKPIILAAILIAKSIEEAKHA